MTQNALDFLVFQLVIKTKEKEKYIITIYNNCIRQRWQTIVPESLTELSVELVIVQTPDSLRQPAFHLQLVQTRR